jgi:hypothetical protein
MNPKLMRKRLTLIITGGLLVIICGSLIVVSLVISWYPPWYSLKFFLSFVFHPTTLLLLFGAWLLFKGLSIPKEPGG